MTSASEIARRREDAVTARFNSSGRYTVVLFTYVGYHPYGAVLEATNGLPDQGARQVYAKPAASQRTSAGFRRRGNTDG